MVLKTVGIIQFGSSNLQNGKLVFEIEDHHHSIRSLHHLTESEMLS